MTTKSITFNELDQSQGIGYMDYKSARNFVTDEGWDAFVELVNSQFQGYKLYACSTDWHNDRRYICKLRGTGGDVLIQWI